MSSLIGIEKVSLVAPICALLLILCTLGSTKIESETFVMPDELVKLAQKNGFTQIVDFYKKLPGFVDPPFVYGYQKKVPVYKSVAFWCEKETEAERADRKYYLLFAVREDNTDNLNLKDSIQWSTIGGLTLFRDSTITFDNFLFVNNLNKKGPERFTPLNYGIRSYYDGNSDVFCQLESEWLVFIKNDL